MSAYNTPMSSAQARTARDVRMVFSQILCRANTRLTQGKGHNVSLEADILSHAQLIASARISALGDFNSAEACGIFHGLVLAAQSLLNADRHNDNRKALLDVLVALRDASMTDSVAVAHNACESARIRIEQVR